ncbi:hypothetical protein PFNF54_01538 [Plasmodium falciparum NF54]|uniref:Uncharacterized protein n=1 Tax=Plasmodium falciparum (isolate NF54) TaxID=5843 RepID=W7JX74_PLAFO|nr:hypothetical protein PFNF54_01538 [Plasmodium falciparum NF54]
MNKDLHNNNSDESEEKENNHMKMGKNTDMIKEYYSLSNEEILLDNMSNKNINKLKEKNGYIIEMENQMKNKEEKKINIVNNEKFQMDDDNEKNNSNNNNNNNNNIGNDIKIDVEKYLEENKNLFFYEHEWINIILQIINKDNFYLAEELMILIFQKEEKLYKNFIEERNKNIKGNNGYKYNTTCDNINMCTYDNINMCTYNNNNHNSINNIENINHQNDNNNISSSDNKTEEPIKLSNFMQQIFNYCPIEWPLLDISILIIVCQVVCYIFNLNKYHMFTDCCILFEKYCIGILLNSSLISSNKNRNTILMFEHDFFYKFIVSHNYKKPTIDVIKYHKNYLKSDNFIEEKTILDVIFLALAYYITVSHNLNEYIQRNNIISYINLLNKNVPNDIRSQGIEENLTTPQKKKRKHISNILNIHKNIGTQKNSTINNKRKSHKNNSNNNNNNSNNFYLDMHIFTHNNNFSPYSNQNINIYKNVPDKKYKTYRHSSYGRYVHNLKKKNYNYSIMKHRYSEFLPISKKQSFLHSKLKRTKTYEKNLKKRLSILRTTKCIKKINSKDYPNKYIIKENNEIQEETKWMDGKNYYDKENNDNIYDNEQKENIHLNDTTPLMISQNNITNLVLSKNSKMDIIIKYQTKTNFEKLLCLIIIEIFNLIYDNRQYSVENILIIRKFFRVFLNFAQKKFLSLSLKRHLNRNMCDVKEKGNICSNEDNMSVLKNNIYSNADNMSVHKNNICNHEDNMSIT